MNVIAVSLVTRSEELIDDSEGLEECVHLAKPLLMCWRRVGWFAWRLMIDVPYVESVPEILARGFRPGVLRPRPQWVRPDMPAVVATEPSVGELSKDCGLDDLTVRSGGHYASLISSGSLDISSGGFTIGLPASLASVIRSWISHSIHSSVFLTLS